MASTHAPHRRTGCLTCMTIGSLAAVWILLIGSAQSPVSRGPYGQHPPTAVDLQAVPLRAEDQPFPSQPTDEQLDDYDTQLRALTAPRRRVRMPQPYSPIQRGHPREEVPLPPVEELHLSPSAHCASDPASSAAVNPVMPGRFPMVRESRPYFSRSRQRRLTRACDLLHEWLAWTVRSHLVPFAQPAASTPSTSRLIARRIY